MGGPSGLQPPKGPMGMDYSNKYKTGGANYQPGRTLPVGQIMAQRTNAQAARYGDGSPVPKGMPINVAGYRSSGLERGGRIGSAAGALGSSGVPTSQRGRLEKYGANPMTGEGAWQQPSWMVSQQQRDQYGLNPGFGYGGMGLLPYTSASPVGSTPMGTNQKPKPADSSKSMGVMSNMAASSAPFGGQSAYNMTTGGGLGVPGSFFGTTIQDMLNRANFIW
jgi:hypothetical protein